MLIRGLPWRTRQVVYVTAGFFCFFLFVCFFLMLTTVINFCLRNSSVLFSKGLDGLWLHSLIVGAKPLLGTCRLGMLNPAILTSHVIRK